MRHYLNIIFSDHSDCLRKKITSIYRFLFLYHVCVWLWAFYSLHNNPLLFSTAVLAYTFGLRHAVDADHIAAIDNVTRKLMQEGKQPVSVGLFFSLGHSTVVVIATVCVALATTTLVHHHLTRWQEIGTMVCTSISALFLILIALINLLIFISIFKIFLQVRHGSQYHEEDIEQLMNTQGFLAKHFRRLFQVITHSWQMYPLGILFGLGFDTATEIILLGITASEIAQGLSFWSVLIFPALFTAGMTLIDTTDSILMVRAYGWAFRNPIRKLYYNLTITLVSVLVAFCLGTVEVLGLIADKMEANGSLWGLVKGINSHFDILGYIIISIFMASWIISIVTYKFMRLDKLDYKVPGE
ncbi:HoxN/HupN/NixA family nickel/cobalt transporter [Legionella maioricensis]|uniref:Nickel/cobalt efflux system n=1 Tax=Legionella maioricensis TaxID=2896528 RepID=A0A9X2ICC4_9GAMM|nr:HoxN/HupN/NixA family nickel/cobalt transporter [Legionella maioricensis]MCL9685295.1 HoxN/HupN/NixA family nickel/cobalt transporter [Legionella maioricensis]MCL9688550.1 HoxN/HupN/NixA family nickel/cobalt transporter [Legionella maioricensis]